MSEFGQQDEIVTPTPKSYSELLSEFNNKNKQEGLPIGELLKFNIEDDPLSVHNPALVVIDGQTYVWARVDKKKEGDSVVRLFKEGKNGEWNIVEGAPVFEGLQDPFYCGMIDDYHIFGGVQVYDVAETPDLGYRTVFYRYKKLFADLVNQNGEICDPFVIGPEKMKDIRLIQIKNDCIGVFTRPQSLPGGFGGRGRIGYFEIDSLDQLENALTEYDQKKDPKTLIKGLFIDQELGDEEWGGANQLFILPDGKIGVLGHIASFGDNSNKKNYCPMTFIFDPETGSVSDVQIIATAEQFPPVEVKKGDLRSAFYPGSLVRLGNGAWLYGGIGHSKVGRILTKSRLGDKVGQL